MTSRISTADNTIMSKIYTNLCFVLFAVTIILPRGWCCLVAQGNMQHSSKSAPKVDSCPFCNHHESSHEDSDQKPFESPRPFSGFCCCEKVHGGLVQKSNSLEDPPYSHNYLTKLYTLPSQASFFLLTEINQTTYPNFQKTHVLNCQWNC